MEHASGADIEIGDGVSYAQYNDQGELVAMTGFFEVPPSKPMAEMDYLEQVQRGIDYIEANLEFDLSPGDVARHAGISQWHFQRILRALTNETLKTCIRSRRFCQSHEKLAATKQRILHIALAAG